MSQVFMTLLKSAQSASAARKVQPTPLFQEDFACFQEIWPTVGPTVHGPRKNLSIYIIALVFCNLGLHSKVPFNFWWIVHPLFFETHLHVVPDKHSKMYLFKAKNMWWWYSWNCWMQHQWYGPHMQKNIELNSLQCRNVFCHGHRWIKVRSIYALTYPFQVRASSCPEAALP